MQVAGFFWAHGGDNMEVCGFEAWGHHGRGVDKKHSDGSFAYGTNTLCKASNFVGIGGLPDGAFAALTEFVIFGNLAGVAFDHVPVKNKVLGWRCATGKWGLWSMCIEEQYRHACGIVLQMFGACAMWICRNNTRGTPAAAGCFLSRPIWKIMRRWHGSSAV